MFEGNHKILQGDSLTVLKSLPDESIDMCVTSPPYWGLRAYHSGDKEIGQEESPLDYVTKLKDVFHEVKRVLKPTGTLWLNLGDTYNGNKKGFVYAIAYIALQFVAHYIGLIY